MTTNTLKSYSVSTLTLALFLGLTGCSGMTPRERDTAVGAGVGAVAGAVLTGGSTLGTAGGAAVGGIIGNKVSK
jgi:osmotically inducible lipoprotein OsmB